jgi:hypothetical protein
LTTPEIITLILALAAIFSILLVTRYGVGVTTGVLCAYCGCRDATDEIDGLAICAECLREMEGER